MLGKPLCPIYFLATRFSYLHHIHMGTTSINNIDICYSVNMMNYTVCTICTIRTGNGQYNTESVFYTIQYQFECKTFFTSKNINIL